MKCEEEQKPAECMHCKGNHRAGAASCPKRVKEANVNKMRKEKNMSYAEAVKTLDSVDRNETVQHEPEEKRKETSEPSICYDKKRFLAFIAMVINCAVEIPQKSERIKMVLEAARRFLGVEDITGEDLDDTLRDGFPTAAQAPGPGL